MKIKCQEHYEKTIKYAESIGDKTLNKCIERLKQWEVNSNGRYEIELYYDSSPYSFGFAEVAKDGTRGVVGGLSLIHIWKIHVQANIASCVFGSPK